MTLGVGNSLFVSGSTGSGSCRRRCPRRRRRRRRARSGSRRSATPRWGPSCWPSATAARAGARRRRRRRCGRAASGRRACRRACCRWRFGSSSGGSERVARVERVVAEVDDSEPANRLVPDLVTTAICAPPVRPVFGRVRRGLDVELADGVQRDGQARRGVAVGAVRQRRPARSSTASARAPDADSPSPCSSATRGDRRRGRGRRDRDSSGRSAAARLPADYSPAHS